VYAQRLLPSRATCASTTFIRPHHNPATRAQHTCASRAWHSAPTVLRPYPGKHATCLSSPRINKRFIYTGMRPYLSARTALPFFIRITAFAPPFPVAASYTFLRRHIAPGVRHATRADVATANTVCVTRGRRLPFVPTDTTCGSLYKRTSRHFIISFLAATASPCYRRACGEHLPGGALCPPS